MDKSFHILALSGSLRKLSHNTTALRAMAILAPDDVSVEVYEGLHQLPLFNPDLQESAVPEVLRLKAALADADGVVIASPEYAHGISGVMKNALDWLVGGDEFVHMPVALVNTSPRASHALEALREVVATMCGDIIDDACVTVSLLGSILDAEGIAADPTFASQLQTCLRMLIEKNSGSTSPRA